MSVKERVQRPDVRPIIDSLFPKPEYNLTTELQAPAKTENYAEMGAAFNYMFTFWLAGNHHDPEIVRWPTNAGLTAIDANYPQYANQARQHVEDAEDALAAYIDTNTVTDALCQASLDLARIEAAYNGDEPRAHHLLRRLGEYDQADLDDLTELYHLIPDEFYDYDSVIVNPDFGPVDVKVGGIDADVVCDNTLLDLKTTKDLTLKVGYWRKLVAYATLAEAANAFHDTFSDVPVSVPELTYVGVYFSRHGVLWTIDTDRIYTHPKYPSFKDWFLNETTD